MNWFFYILIGFISLIPTFWLSVKAKEWTNQLLFKKYVDESSPKSWFGDAIATGIFFIYSVIMFDWMPR